MTKYKKNTEVNISAQKQSGPVLMAVLAVFILAAAAVYYLSRSKSESLLMMQKPVENIMLPAGIKMKMPEGFSVFKTEAAGSVSYSFVKYDETRKNNAFFKADFSIIPVIDLGFEKIPDSLDAPGVKSGITAKKISDYKAIQQGFRDDIEGKETYDMDYSAYKPALDSELHLNGRIWHRYDLEKYESVERDSLQKTWTNIYSIHGIYLIVLDYITVKSLDKNAVKEDETAMASIEADITAILEGIIFN